MSNTFFYRRRKV